MLSGTIEAGLTAKGTFNFLGFEMKADIRLPFRIKDLMKEGFRVHIETSPIDFAWGWIQVYDANEENGPKFKLDVTVSKTIEEIRIYFDFIRDFS